MNSNFYKKFHDIWRAHGVEDLYFDSWIYNYKLATDSQKLAVDRVKLCVGTTKPIVMLGTVGGGKTHIAQAIVKHTLMKRETAFYYTLGRFFRDYRATLSDPEKSEHAFFDKAYKAKVLVLEIPEIDLIDSTTIPAIVPIPSASIFMIIS